MAKKSIYAPGELSRVRSKLGVDDDEAKRMASVLGGEVGYEQNPFEEEEKKLRRNTRHEKVELSVKGGRGGRRPPRNRIETAAMDGMPDSSGLGMFAEPKKTNPADDPAVPFKASYFERLKMDRYAATSEFDIKNQIQAMFSMLSVFSDPPDYVNPLFVTRRFNEYYKRLEKLVTATRSLLPRNNLKRSERLKKVSPFAFSILDTIRYWNIERIASDMAKIQSHPRTVFLAEFSDILRAIYKPLVIMEQLKTDTHIRNAYKLLYKLLYIENPMESKEKYQETIRIAIAMLTDVRNEIHFLLYPMLMKLLSDRWLPYERFFVDRRNRFMAFLKITDQDRINLPVGEDTSAEDSEMDAVQEDIQNEQAAEGSENSDLDKEPPEDPNDPEVVERKARESAQEAEQKAVERSLAAMELLFPKAGWEKLAEFPDLYPYFASTFNFKRGCELIAPNDPLQQVYILMHILLEFFFAIRYVSFGSIEGPDGNPVRVDEFLGSIINNWQRYVDDSFGKVYLPCLSEFCQMLEKSAEARISVFGKRSINELNWTKRLYFLPYYKFETIGPPPFQKQETIPIYSEVRTLRKYLTAVINGIEQGKRAGGAEAKAPCDGIENPWEPYKFEIPSLISRRLDALFVQGKRTNAGLLYFTLSATILLDHLINDENSWAYEGRSSGPLFRSVNDEGIVPIFGMDIKIDADQIFKQSVKQRQEEIKASEKAAAKAADKNEKAEKK